eukprot:CAMPEP_0179431022 /NCGR_PEP_ID=MMETSP0799-20121207/16007_1 /TAXON_ID=46947 /ORGANISM="Geminigera cryophila, Strain CCMP2564" /LENGTH=188 /DNA_ID=CAMNT_0021207727 /DNA_START=67 /DNA_END=633 /DNA_ORIENTATION=+
MSHAPVHDMQGHRVRAEGSGAHVRDRPEMQQKARCGQAHWHETAKMMRLAWQERWDTDPVFRRRDFQEQIDVCSRLQIKSQHECILRVLQISLSDGLLVALPFSLSSSDSFLGWTGFQVSHDRAAEFRERIHSLFPETPQENTVHTAFRRTGLVPDKWPAAWRGATPFKFKASVRQSYTDYTRISDAK